MIKSIIAIQLIINREWGLAKNEKSTLCDAVEFAPTGSINKYAVEKAAMENLSDYLWWRGEGLPMAHYVTASCKSDDGKAFTAA